MGSEHAIYILQPLKEGGLELCECDVGICQSTPLFTLLLAQLRVLYFVSLPSYCNLIEMRGGNSVDMAIGIPFSVSLLRLEFLCRHLDLLIE